jgi:hypothetical protein
MMSRLWIYLCAAPAVLLLLGSCVNVFIAARHARPQTRWERWLLRWNPFSAVVLPDSSLAPRGQRAKHAAARLVLLYLTITLGAFAVVAAVSLGFTVLTWIAKTLAR